MKWLTDEQLAALLEMQSALGAFAGHFEGRRMPPVVERKHAAAKAAVYKAWQGLVADQQPG